MISGKVFIVSFMALSALAATVSALAEPLAIEREIKLKERAEAFSQVVCLGDLIEDGWIAGRCAVEKNACCRWNLGGERVRVFTRAEIQKELVKINWNGIKLALGGAPGVEVTQTRRELSAGEIQAKISSAAVAKTGEDAKNLSISALRTQGTIHVSLEEESDWDVVLPDPIVERGTVKVVSTKDPSRALGWAQVTLQLNAEVYVARKTVRPTAAVSLEDFELRKANLFLEQSPEIRTFRRGQFPEGTRARQSILAGTPLTTAAIERIPMVKLGDAVTLILRGDNLRISTKGVVQGSAAVGDMVTVQLSRYNRTFRGRLVEGRLVEVWL